MKRTKEDAALTRRAVLDAAFQVFGRKGYSRTSLVEVAKEANLTRGAVYWHFGSKYELFKALLEETYSEVQSIIQENAESGQTPIQKIKQIFLGLLKIIGTKQEFKAMDEILVFGREGDKDMVSLYNQHHKFVMRFRETMNVLIDEGIRIGEIDPGYNPDLIGTFLHSLMGGIQEASLCSKKGTDILKQAEKLVDIVIYGIAARSPKK